MSDMFARAVETDDSVGVEESSSVADRLRKLRDVGTERLRASLEDSREVVRTNPIGAVLIAAGVGLVIGYLLVRSRDMRSSSES